MSETPKPGSMEEAHEVIRMIKEDAFRRGAAAMQAKIVAFLMMKNQFEIAPQVLAMAPPEESKSRPDHVTIDARREEGFGE